MKKLLLFLLLAALCETGHGHPVPDVPVRTTFHNDGKAVIRVEVDPRCFAQDPLNEPYLENQAVQSYTEKQKSELFERTKKFIADTIEFTLEPKGQVLPKFEMSFTTFASQALKWNAKNPEKNSLRVEKTPVVITAKWSTDASKMLGYQIQAKKGGKLSVQFINHIGDEKQRLNVLFPGEESYELDLSMWAKSVKSEPVESSKTKK